MMNPRDREHTWQERDGGNDAPTGGGLLWLIAVIIAAIGLAVMARHGFNNIVIVPIGVSLFFMLMFLISHHREAKRLAWRREVARLREAAREIQSGATGHAPAPRQLSAVDVGMRKIFDRFDTKVISHGRMYGWEAPEIAGFLDFARDYVDTQHAQALLEGNEKGELDRHLDAALERALLQHDIANPDRKKDEPPF